jgi:hypothetical protein
MTIIYVASRCSQYTRLWQPSPPKTKNWMKCSDSFLRKKGFSPEISISVGLWRRSPKKGQLVPLQLLLMILWCSQSGDYPENDLAKFGYIIDIQVEKKQNPSIFLTAFWKLLQGAGDRKFFLFEIWWIWVILPMQNPLYRSKSYFSGRNLTKICQ